MIQRGYNQENTIKSAMSRRFYRYPPEGNRTIFKESHASAQAKSDFYVPDGGYPAIAE